MIYNSLFLDQTSFFTKAKRNSSDNSPFVNKAVIKKVLTKIKAICIPKVIIKPL